MRMTRIVAPTAYPVSLVEVKSHCNIYHSDWDANLDRLIAAITQRLDGYEGILGRALMPQTWRMSCDCLNDNEIDIPLPPLISIDSLQYIDSTDVLTTITDAEYQIINNDKWSSKLRPVYGTVWPVAKDQPDSVYLTFTAGYPVGEFPEAIKHAMLMIISHWNEQREDMLLGSTPHEILHSAKDLLAPYRRIPL